MIVALFVALSFYTKTTCFAAEQLDDTYSLKRDYVWQSKQNTCFAVEQLNQM